MFLVYIYTPCENCLFFVGLSLTMDIIEKRSFLVNSFWLIFQFLLWQGEEAFTTGSDLATYM